MESPHSHVHSKFQHYEPYIDFPELLRRTQSSNSSFNEPGALPFDELRRL
jgi:hypothetical protein